MQNSRPEDHKRYLNLEFVITCSLTDFSSSEISVLKKYGSWLSALMQGKINANTEKQKHFLMVCERKEEPINEYEHAWTKYLQQLGKEIHSESIIKNEGQSKSILVPNTINEPSFVEFIQGVVSKHYNIPLEILLSKNRQKNISKVRQIAMYILKELTNYSLPEIGDAFARDHTTVLHACRKMTELMNSDQDFNSEIKRLSKLVVDDLENHFNNDDLHRYLQSYYLGNNR